MLRTAVKIVVAILLLCGAGVLIRGQADGKLPAFDVASVERTAPDAQPTPISQLGPGDVYAKTGGRFFAQGHTLATYIHFAFGLVGSETEAVDDQLPGWARSERYTIRARTYGDPEKDTGSQMRLMMRSLLAERFGLKVHYETRQAPIFAVRLAAGKPGPQLRRHSEADAPCAGVAPDGAERNETGALASGVPAVCGGMTLMQPSAPGRFRFGARNVTMAFIAKQLTSLGDLGRPAVDQTGLTGTFDFTMEFVPDISSTREGYPDFQGDPSGPTFLQAIQEQLGLKLESTKAPARFLTIDHVEHPTQN
jgi:uncharacterized protein (TIGR03435 family)